MKKLLLLSILSFNLFAQTDQQLPFNKVVLWGHKLHSHTHSYIHYAFVKAFKHLGYETLWLDKKDNISGIDFSNTLFITEGQVDQDMPLRRDCRYILHNCNMAKYKTLFDAGNCIILQVYTHDVLPRNVEKIDDLTYIDKGEKILYMPWATDLLPFEIDAIKASLVWPLQKKKEIHFVGTLSGCDFTNIYNPFIAACKENGVTFKHRASVGADENVRLIQESYIAPAFEGQWQCQVGYAPCRIFKNISYGQPGVTNSKTVYALFKEKIVFNEDTHQLFYDAQKAIQTMTQEDLFWQMDFVRDHHTYLNRIEHLLNFLNLIQPFETREIRP
jgi:hypothetical protein